MSDQREIYVVLYDEADEPGDVLAAFDTREAAEAYVDGADTMVVVRCTLSET